MGASRYGRARSAFAAAVPLALIGLMVFLAWSGGECGRATAHFPPTPTWAEAPHPLLDFSIGIDEDGDTTDDCNTVGTDRQCVLSAGQQFTVTTYLNNRDYIAYGSIGVQIEYSGAIASRGRLTAGPSNPGYLWPECSFQATAFNDNQGAGPLFENVGCAVGISDPDSTYTGPIAVGQFQCSALGAGVLQLIHGPAETFISEPSTNRIHGEDLTQTEALTVYCGVPKPTPTYTPTLAATATPTDTPTPTPCDGPCPTATPTRTPTPAATDTPTPTETPTETPTPTRTPSPTPSRTVGDANGDRRVDSLDALWVLWYNVGVLMWLPSWDDADANRDGVVDPLDAALILQYEAGLLWQLPPIWSQPPFAGAAPSGTRMEARAQADDDGIRAPDPRVARRGGMAG